MPRCALQALMYPLLVACKSQSNQRRDAAMSVVEQVRIHSAALVEQAQLVRLPDPRLHTDNSKPLTSDTSWLSVSILSNQTTTNLMRWHSQPRGAHRGHWTARQVSTELIRMAILWHEMWHEALEEASRLYFGESNVEGMLATLMPLHEMMDAQGPTTLKEISFIQVCSELTICMLLPSSSVSSRGYCVAMSSMSAFVACAKPLLFVVTGVWPRAHRGGGVVS